MAARDGIAIAAREPRREPDSKKHGFSFLHSRQLGTGLPWYALRATSHTPVPNWLMGM